jgi:thymidylate kinase
MKIAFIGTQCNGKSTLIQEFREKWPMYKQREKTYRDLIKEKKLKNNKNGTEESQKAILDALVDEIILATATEEKHLVFDRCVIDNIAYTLWLNEKNKVSDEFVMDSRRVAMETIKMYDIIFYLPLREEIKIEKRKGRDIDPVYRQEIDYIFRALVTSYERNSGTFFPIRDCPAVITLEGPPDLRCEQIRLYLKDTGVPYGEEDGSLISS